MKEAFLHHIWKTKKFNHKELTTTKNRKIQIINYGSHNFDAGPDFSHAKIKIGETLWVGQVELHIKASEWNNHKHQNDPAYNNVILHVVYEDNSTVFNQNGISIPTLELKGRINPSYIESYQRLQNQSTWIPCQNLLRPQHFEQFEIFKEQLLIERLSNKAKQIQSYLDLNKNNWEETLFWMIAKYLGGKVNREAYLKLAQATDLKKLISLSSLIQKESLLYGQAGLIEGNDEYALTLGEHYDFLQKKWKLRSMNSIEWKLSRLRPSNFPTLRISQLAHLYQYNFPLFQKLLVCEKLTEAKAILESHASDYWDSHYQFGKLTKVMKKRLGTSSINILFINAIIPVLFVYAQKQSDNSLIDKLLSWLQELPAEINKITKGWKELGVDIKDASQSQATIQLKTVYCDTFKCLDCQIGNQILFKNLDR